MSGQPRRNQTNSVPALRPAHRKNPSQRIHADGHKTRFTACIRILLRQRPIIRKHRFGIRKRNTVFAQIGRGFFRIEFKNHASCIHIKYALVKRHVCPLRTKDNTSRRNDGGDTGISVQRLGDILNAPTEAAGAKSSLPPISGRITLDMVQFRYRPDTPEVLKGISVDIAPGEVIGIVGRSGSGKSTLTKLIQRLYVPERGRVLIDGIDLTLIDAASLRRQIGVVLQENVLFNRTLRENIALADPGAPLEQVIQAAKLAGAHEFILELPEAYDTMVGEHGSTLSGGQRQRIAIARALMSEPRILIFDEATSALDYESERIIQQNMSAICQNRTVIIIAHRLSAVRHANRILVMDHGQIVEAGTHAELLLHEAGHYSRLHRLQQA